MIEGPRLLAEALDASIELEAVYLEAAYLDRGAPVPLAERLTAAGVEWFTVADDALDRIGDVGTSQGVLAVAVSPDLDAPPPVGTDLVLVLVDVADPGNVGTLLRAADATGAAVVLAGRTADVLAPKVVRAAAGALARVTVHEVADGGAALDVVAALGATSVGAVLRAGTSLDDLDRLVDLSGPVALVLGSESHGLAADVIRRVDQIVEIPMPGRAESLNVAMAGTVLAFEVLRQRRAINRLDAERPARQGGRP